MDGFTFSRLKPYETWESLRKEALKFWEIYANRFSPECITRVSLGATAIIIQALEGQSDPNIVPIILDIDVFKEAQFNANGKDAWETIDKLHDLKNEIFFQSITEKTAELFQ